jgi:histone H3/H4
MSSPAVTPKISDEALDAIAATLEAAADRLLREAALAARPPGGLMSRRTTVAVSGANLSGALEEVAT